MASDKQELIQLHQLLAEVRIFANEKLGLSTKIEDLPAYDDTGITSIDIDADVGIQKNAVLALAKEIGTTIEVEQMSAAEKTTAVNGETATVTDGNTVTATSTTNNKQITPAETVEVTLLDVTKDGISLGEAEINPQNTTTETKIENEDIIKSSDEDETETVNASILGISDNGFTAEETDVEPNSNQKRDEKVTEPDVETEVVNIEETTLTDNWDVEKSGDESDAADDTIEHTEKKDEIEQLDKSVKNNEVIERPQTTIANES